MPTPPSVGYDAYAHHGRNLIAGINQELHHTYGGGYGALSSRAQNIFPTVDKPVGILGAGAGGLYTAMILEDLGIPYSILEARDRVGGRLFTYEFPDDLGAPYNYYDVGAMRFPNITSMNRVFNLFENPNLNTPDIALEKRLTPFYFNGFGDDRPFLDYNGVTVRQNAVPAGDPFKASAVLQNPDKRAYIAAGTKAIVDDVINPYAAALLADLEHNTTTGWEKMLSVDQYSTRAYMSLKYEPNPDLNIKGPLPTDVVNWLETYDKSTGWYDRSFTETVLEAVAFGQQTDPSLPPTDWHCVNGGSQRIADAMATYLRKKNPKAISLKKRVNAIGLTGPGTISVTANYRESYNFSHVVSTIPLPVMRTLDLKKAKLTPMQANAMRDLNYGPSVKIGMQFKTAWWTTGKDRNGKKLGIIGGASYTDRPLRTVVYPSFGDSLGGHTTTLIASYCWTEDSERLGALVDQDDDYLVKIVLQELADLHNVDLKFLHSQLIDTKAWSWSHDPYTMGAFAFFGPGKFKNVYESLNAPAADGLLHFAGEALSVRHAWVEGALDSAWRAVAEMLFSSEFSDDIRKKFVKNWGQNLEWTKDDSDDIFTEKSHLYDRIVFAELARK